MRKLRKEKRVDWISVECVGAGVPACGQTPDAWRVGLVNPCGATNVVIMWPKRAYAPWKAAPLGRVAS